MKAKDRNKDDAVTIAPHLHTVIFEDDRLRVLKVKVAPGTGAAMHWHPQNINYVLSGGKLRFGKEDGSSVEVDLAEGQVTSSPPGRHTVCNVGNTTIETVQVELK